VQLVSDEFDIIMFSDQDDVWLPNKIEAAISALSQYGGPALYCSRLQLVDSDLNPIGLSPALPRRPRFENALTENIVVGCTAAFNKPALRLIRQVGDVSRIHFHDWWAYLVIATFGIIHPDPEPRVLYRQHGGNAVGMGAGLGRYLKIAQFLRQTNWVHIMFNQIENLRFVFGHKIPTEKLRLMDRFFNPHQVASVLRLISAPIKFRERLIDDVFFRGLVVRALINKTGLLPGQKSIHR
jgi:hypothetical protein